MKKSKLQWSESVSASGNARKVLPGLAADYFAEGRKAIGENSSARKLHRFRLHTKRLRYTLELFRGLYGPGLETRIAELRKLQNYLGDISDCEATRRLLSDGNKKSPQRDAILQKLETMAAEHTRKLHWYWKRSFDAAGKERRWTAYLRRYASAARK